MLHSCSRGGGEDDEDEEEEDDEAEDGFCSVGTGGGGCDSTGRGGCDFGPGVIVELAIFIFLIFLSSIIILN